ncbi:MAG: nitrile hydratase accessory protein [Hyphomicrobiales bacterium]|nr:nitrile hydratase accessory protein [Hyphomicrobiales bacterium]
MLPEIRRDEDGPVFAEPWQAQAFAMAVKLHEEGVFTWPEWAEFLGREIAAAGSRPDRGDYYDHWLAALEKIVEAKGVMSREERLSRKQAWDKAARATPHGQPIVLDKG